MKLCDVGHAVPLEILCSVGFGLTRVCTVRCHRVRFREERERTNMLTVQDPGFTLKSTKMLQIATESCEDSWGHMVLVPPERACQIARSGSRLHLHVDRDHDVNRRLRRGVGGARQNISESRSGRVHSAEDGRLVRHFL